MEREAFSINGKTVITMDDRFFHLMGKTAARMIYPKNKKHRSRRDSLVEDIDMAGGHLWSDPIISRYVKRGLFVGTIFFLKCILATKGNVYSDRKLDEAITQGLFSDIQDHLSWPSGGTRKVLSEFRRVPHLWAAETAWRMNNPESVPFELLFENTPAFLNYADSFLDVSAKTGLLPGRQKLWMPASWRMVAQTFKPTPLAASDFIDLDNPYIAKLEERLDAVKEEYQDKRLWENT